MLRIVTVLLLLILKSPAYAGLLVEPYMGFESGNQTATVSDAYVLSPGASLDAKIVNTVLGGRFGYVIPLGWLAFDASLSSGGKTTYLASNSATRDSVTGPTYTRTTVGASAGTDFGPKRNMRFWLGYIFSDLMVHNSGGTKNTNAGTGYKLGVGILPIEYMSLNLEYIVRKYTSATGDSYINGLTFSDQYGKLEHTTLMLSVSAPFYF